MIVEITQEDVAAIYGVTVTAKLAYGRALVEDGEVLGVAGVIAVDHDPRLWAFLDILKPMTPAQGFRGVKSIALWLKSLSDDVKGRMAIQCDGAFAERLLAVLGFEATDEYAPDQRDGTMKRIWICRHS